MWTAKDLKRKVLSHSEYSEYKSVLEEFPIGNSFFSEFLRYNSNQNQQIKFDKDKAEKIYDHIHRNKKSKLYLFYR